MPIAARASRELIASSAYPRPGSSAASTAGPTIPLAPQRIPPHLTWRPTPLGSFAIWWARQVASTSRFLDSAAARRPIVATAAQPRLGILMVGTSMVGVVLFGCPTFGPVTLSCVTLGIVTGGLTGAEGSGGAPMIGGTTVGGVGVGALGVGVGVGATAPGS